MKTEPYQLFKPGPGRPNCLPTPCLREQDFSQRAFTRLTISFLRYVLLWIQSIDDESTKNILCNYPALVWLRRKLLLIDTAISVRVVKSSTKDLFCFIRKAEQLLLGQRSTIKFERPSLVAVPPLSRATDSILLIIIINCYHSHQVNSQNCVVLQCKIIYHKHIVETSYEYITLDIILL